MKVAYDAKRFFSNSSGLGNYSRDLIKILIHYSTSFQAILLSKNETKLGSEILKSDQVKFVKTDQGLFPRQLSSGKLAQRNGAQIFHGLSGELPFYWEKKISIKKIVTIHDLIFLRFPKFYSIWDRKVHFFKFKKAAKQADLVIAISEQTKEDIITYLKISPEKIRVVYQGCSDQFKVEFSKSDLEMVRNKFNLPSEFILYVGTIETRKNLLNIIKAISTTEIPLVVVGKETKYALKVKKYIRKHKMENQVIFLKNIEIYTLAKLYQMAEIFVYPSLFEGFGIPIIEALFSKTPVITSNVSSLPEAGGPYSLYVDPTNVNDLKSKIKFLWDNPSERIRRADLGREYVKKFEDKQIAKNLLDVYHEVL